MNEKHVRRKLSGILSADAAGYSRLMQEDEASTIRRLEDSKELMTNHIQQYRGRVVDAPGDNLLAEFGSVVNATECGQGKRIVVLAEKLDAAHAVDWGLADEAVPDGTAVGGRLEMARRAASLPPNGVRLCKAAINAHANALNATASHADMDQFALTQNSEDCAEGLRAFLEKSDPAFTGR